MLARLERAATPHSPLRLAAFAVDTEHAGRDTQFAEPDRQRRDMPVMQRNEISTQQQDVRRERIDRPHDRIEQTRIGERPRVDVRGERNPERLGERLQRQIHIAAIDPQAALQTQCIGGASSPAAGVEKRFGGFASFAPPGVVIAPAHDRKQPSSDVTETK